MCLYSQLTLTTHSHSECQAAKGNLFRQVYLCLDSLITSLTGLTYTRHRHRRRYHARRALFLVAVAERLSSSESVASVELCGTSHDDQTRPCLLLRPSPSSSGSSSVGAEGLRVRILPVVSPGTFSASKLSPERNCIRWVPKPSPVAKPGVAAADEVPPPPTPLYNAGVLQDALCLAHAEFLRAAFAAAPRLRDALLLLKVGAWLQFVPP